MKSTKYLIVKLSSLGDVIQAIPFAYYLDGEVSWAVEEEYAPLLQSVPAVDHVIPIPFRKMRRKEVSFNKLLRSLRQLGEFDCVIDLQGNCKSGVVTKFARSKEKIGLKNVAEWPNRLVTNRKIAIPQNYSISEQYKHFFEQAFGFRPSDPLIKLRGEKISLPKRTCMICIGSRWKNKQLPESAWKEFLHEIERLYRVNFLFVFGEEKEPIAQAFPGSISIIKPEFGTWQRLMREVDLILTVDSASLALSNTTNTPTFALFGPSNSKVYGPTRQGSGAFQGSCPYGETFVKRCSKLRTCPTGACLRSVGVKELLEAFQNQCDFPPAEPPRESSPYPQSESSLCKK